MEWLAKLLEQDTTKLLAIAVLLFAAAPIVVSRVRGRKPVVSLASLFNGPPSEETISPSAARYIDGRIEHKVNGALAGPVLNLSREQAELRDDVERIDREREQTGRDIAVIREQITNLASGQRDMNAKLDRMGRGGG